MIKGLYTKQGLTFVYQQYEIAPYAAGLINFDIPYDKVLPLLTKDAASLFAMLRCTNKTFLLMPRKGVSPLFMKANPASMPFRFANPELLQKSQRVTQLTKLAYRSRRLCALQVIIIIKL